MDIIYTKKGWQALSLVFLAILILVYVFLIAPPDNFPKKSIFTVEEGMNLDQLGSELEIKHIIRSPLWFRMAAISVGGERSMKAGDYYFEREQNVFTVALRIAMANRGIETVRITIPEGFTNQEISNLFDQRFLKFDHNEFLSLAPQGFLFPDTYFIEVGATASSTIKLLRNNFDNKTFKLTTEIKNSGHSLRDIITIASIIESETRTNKDRPIVSGILWKRLKIGMPLQVDSSPETYDRKGLPNDPISNPGLESIVASIHPLNTAYLYFLTDKAGNVYYAKTFDEHQRNRELYLNK